MSQLRTDPEQVELTLYLETSTMALIPEHPLLVRDQPGNQRLSIPQLGKVLAPEGNTQSP